MKIINTSLVNHYKTLNFKDYKNKHKYPILEAYLEIRKKECEKISLIFAN